MDDKGDVVYNSSKLIFIFGPLLLLVCIAPSVYWYLTRDYFHSAFATALGLLVLILFTVGTYRDRETVWTRSAGILLFPNPLPRMIRFRDVTVVYPLYSYSPTTRKMITGKLCLMDRKGNLFVFRNPDSITAIILGLSKRWKDIYVPDYDLQNLSASRQSRMKFFLSLKNSQARLSKFVVFFLFGGGVILVGYLVMKVELRPFLFGAALLCGLLAYFGSIFLIGTLLIQRENAKRTVMRMKEAGYHKRLDKGLLKLFMTSDVPDYDGTYDMFSEVAVQFSRAPKEVAKKPKASVKGSKKSGASEMRRSSERNRSKKTNATGPKKKKGRVKSSGK